MTAIEIALSVFSLILSGIAKILWSKLQKIEENAAKANSDLADFKLYVAKEHPTQDHLSKAIEGFTRSFDAVFHKLESMQSEIKESFDGFRDKLDRKQDRP